MKRLVYALFGFLFILYYICYQGVLSHVLYYNEQHHLFLFSKSYFQQCIRSEGWLEYVTDFMIQFFYYPALGSALLALLLASVYLLASGIIKIITGRYDLLQLSVIPSLSLFFYTMEVGHSLSVVPGSVLCLSALYVLLFIVRRSGRLFPLFELPAIGGKKQHIWLVAVFLTGYIGGGSYYFFRNYNRSERMMLKTE